MTHDKTNQFINDYQQGSNPQAQTPEETLAADLLQLADSLQMDDTVSTTLQAEFTEEDTTKMIPFPTQNRRIMRVAAVLLAFIGIFGLSTLQPVRTFAQEMLDIFIPRQAEETRTIEYVEFDDEDIVSFRDYTEFVDSVPFDLQTPSYIPPAYSYDFRFGVYLEPRNVSSTVYMSEYGTFVIEVKQQPLEDIDKGLLWSSFEPYTIGPDAKIVDLVIEVDEDTRYDAQYVRGSWVGEDEFTWSDTFGFYTMRWQDNEYAYEIFWHERPRGDLTEEMIAIAESMYATDEN